MSIYYFLTDILLKFIEITMGAEMKNLRNSFGLFILVFSAYWITDFSVYWFNGDVEHFFIQDMRLVIKFIIISIVSVGIIAIFNFENRRLREKMQNILEKTSGEALNNTNKTLSYQSLSINTRLIKVAQILKDEFKLDEVFITLKSHTHLEILNHETQNNIFDNSQISLKINRNNLKNLISKEFLHQSHEIKIEKVKQQNSKKEFSVLNIPITSKYSKNKWGMITLLVPKRKENIQVILSQALVIAENIALNIFLDSKSKQDKESTKSTIVKVEKESLITSNIKNSYTTIFINIKSIEDFASQSDEHIKHIEHSIISLTRNLIRDIDISILWAKDKIILILEEDDKGTVNILVHRLKEKLKELGKVDFGIMEFIKISDEHRMHFIKRLEKILAKENEVKK